MADLFRKYKSLFSTTSNSFGTGSDVEITLNSVTGLPTDTSITLTFDRVDSNGTALTTMERITGTLSGTTFAVEARGVDNTSDQAHTTPVVEQILNAADWNALMDGLLVNYNQDGSLKNITVDEIITDTITVNERMTASDIALTNGVSVDSILDENDLTSDSDTALATQQSIKAYVDRTKTYIQVKRIGTQTIPHNTATKVQFNSEDNDNLNEFDPTTNYRFTASKNGVYAFYVNIQFVYATSVLIRGYINGTGDNTMYYQTVQPANYHSNIATFIKRLKATDYVEIYVMQSYGSDNDIHGDQTTRLVISKLN